MLVNKVTNTFTCSMYSVSNDIWVLQLIMVILALAFHIQNKIINIEYFFNVTATAYGDGVYFAVNADYSARDTYSRPDGQGHKRMYLCKVLTGEFTKGMKGMRVPPAKQGQQSHILYDSVVDNMSSPDMFIIFNDTQGYPDYLITFK